MGTRAIIAAVKAHPELWCSTHENFKNRFLRERIVRGISHEMGMKPDIFKKKWKNVKDQFRKEVKKELTFKEENVVWECHWPYWESLQFMKFEIMQSMTCGAANHPGTLSPGGSTIHSYPISTELVKTEGYNGVHPGTTGDYNEDSQSEVDHILADVDPLNQDEESETSREQTVKRVGSSLQGPPAKYFASARSLGEIQEPDWVDEDYHFCMSLLPTLRSLSSIQKLEFRGKVNQWLLESVLTNQSTQP